MSAREDTPSRPVPLLPLRDLVVFPRMRVPLWVGREKSCRTIEEAVGREGKEIFLVAQRQERCDKVGPGDVFDVGGIGTVAKLFRLEDMLPLKVLVYVRRRGRLTRWIEREDFFEAEIAELPEADAPSSGALIEQVRLAFTSFCVQQARMSPEDLSALLATAEAPRLASAIMSWLKLGFEDRQALLELPSASAQLERILALLGTEPASR